MHLLGKRDFFYYNNSPLSFARITKNAAGKTRGVSYKTLKSTTATLGSPY